MVFACMIGNDLLYTVYDVPSICISRTNQRCNALARLGLPRTAFDDVDEARWKSQPEAHRGGPLHSTGGATSLGSTRFLPPIAGRAADAAGGPAGAAVNVEELVGGMSTSMSGSQGGGLGALPMASASLGGGEPGSMLAGRRCSDSEDETEWMALQREGWPWIEGRRNAGPSLHACIHVHALQRTPACTALACGPARPWRSAPCMAML